jgi:voltage-gated potassium channel Kch
MTTGALIRRLGKLETTAGVGLVMPTIFVSFVAPDGSERRCDTATVDGIVWHRQPGEAEDAFHSRVAAEAKPLRANRAVIAFIE